MEIIRESSVGRKESGDTHISVSPSKNLSLEIRSSVERLYGDKLKREIENELERLGVDNGAFLVEDDGALKYITEARLEAAIVAATDDKIPYRKAETNHAFDIERLRRSRLYIPGNNPRLFQNAWLYGADMLLLDLEDSVTPSQKFSTRYLVRNTLLSLKFGQSETAVRINPVSSPFGLDDLKVIVPAGPEIIVLPKAESAQDIHDLKLEISRIQQDAGTDHKIGIVPIIESAMGIIRAEEIASVEGVIMLAFGAEDYTRDIGAERTRNGKEHFVARCNLVTAAKAHAKLVSDTVFSDFADKEGLINSTREARELGFDGKGLIHPSQIEPVHKVFTPDQSELLFAVKAIAAAEEAERNGSGVIAIGRKMIDQPIVERARRQLKLAEKMGIEIPEIDKE